MRKSAQFAPSFLCEMQRPCAINRCFEFEDLRATVWLISLP
jgi:hypothetical protein